MITAPRSEPRPTHWPSVAQFALSTLALLGAWGFAAFFLVAGLVARASAPASSPSNPSFGIYAVNGVFAGLLLLPSAAFSLARLLDYPLKPGKLWQDSKFLRTIRRIIHPKSLVFLFPLLALAGHSIIRLDVAAWLLPALNLLALSIPVLWFTWLGVRRLPQGSPQLTWGIFASGLVLGPVVILLLEVVGLLLFIPVGALYLAIHPELVVLIKHAAEQLDSGLSIATLAELTNNPAIVFTMLLFIAVLVPLIEEAIKPVGVWLLAGRNLSPTSGFTAGIISGAGYALFENLGQAVSGQEWPLFVIGRLGTTVLHIFNTGIIGYTLALSWKERRYRQLAGAYLLAVVIHGLWNALSIVGALAGLGGSGGLLPAFLTPLSAIIMPLVAVTVLVLLLLANRKLSAQAFPVPAENKENEK